jgi:hypothetical protein
MRLSRCRRCGGRMRHGWLGPEGELHCSACARKVERDRRALELAEPRTCGCGCGETFLPAQPHQRFVDVAHRMRAYRRRKSAA